MSDPVVTAPETTFRSLSLPPTILGVLEELGYETPTPIQQQAIPALLAGKDILGHAPTGTGKTAAFALPLLSRIDTQQDHTQILALAPTRELAIQVAEAFQRYASGMPDFRVVPIYGGQQYGGQLRQLKRGAQVVVGTPGRVMDHLRRGTLQLSKLQALVLDEADEMLRMGFIEEVEWILTQTPPERQTALFSATMPKQVERIARQHLKDPAKVSIKARTATAETIRQRYWQVSGVHKLEALTRILETERFEGILLFVRTKIATTELANKLSARGFAAAAMNGDMVQAQREQTVEQLKQGKLNILVATDVAARGLDVDRISHVINYDVPYDTEAYIHRIGRTGRAGRQGEAILFVAPRERRMLSAIERATRQKIERMQLPTTAAVNEHRIANFKAQIAEAMEVDGLEFMRELVEQFQQEQEVSALDIAAALGQLVVGDQGLLLQEGRNAAPVVFEEAPSASRSPSRRFDNDELEPGTERFRIEVGREHGVKPGNIVGAIANEAGIDGEYIGRIVLEDDHSTVDLPQGMPKEVFQSLKRVTVCGRQLQISRIGQGEAVDLPVPDDSAAGDPRQGGRAPRRRPVDGGSRERSTKRSPGAPGARAKPDRPRAEGDAGPSRKKSDGKKKDGKKKDGKKKDMKKGDFKKSRKRKSNAAGSIDRNKS